ncbi:MAG: hypothetical protein HN742_30575 [Lentisphaerae bacterium]|jgi:hypothetical protein|nr:hypothetical protein [Lentisphaerota bacterium]MBT4820964.1 hypothetical protein [Lentisphaerota bacterium]MBT5612076.1 hypothetical protein [Lentisphaerota bacterium]MBT7061881.1 hypothetical protein [Lentisphaerota bacterium]MBT7846256.1 hypothetical protein [Lentisphaerota bacterium]
MRYCDRMVFAGVLLCLCIAVCAAPKEDVQWERLANTQKTLQVGIARLLVTKAPQFKELIEVQRDLQLTMIGMRGKKYYYLLETAPGRIARDKGFSAWVNFKWSAEDEAKLEASDPGYVELCARKRALKDKSQGHPSWPELRKVFAEVRPEQEYQALYKQLMATTEEIGVSLKENAANSKVAAPVLDAADALPGK